MSQAKVERASKRQWGQFHTPPEVARRLVADLPLTAAMRVLEPSAGDGAFVIPLVERFMELHAGTAAERLARTLAENVFAVEIDPAVHAALLGAIRERFGPLPVERNVVCGDFFTTDFPEPFDLVVGNPPFGGTLAPGLQGKLDALYGQRDGAKIKKETYSFFIVRAVERLAPGGRLRFICSDSFLTIATMKGLREFLLNRGTVRVSTLAERFEGTSQSMVVLDLALTGRAERMAIDGRDLDRRTIDLTGNRSWRITEALAPLFRGPTLGDVMVATSGMTVGRNELFVREIVDGAVLEPYRFEFREEPITLAGELSRARLGELSEGLRKKIVERERRGETRRVVEGVRLPEPRRVVLPHPDYRPYNKACGSIVWAPPRHAIYWRDDGEAVLTFKRTGNWYLRGVGGQRHFGREGLTWQLVSNALNPRHLPAGQILDSGAPCAFLREGQSPDELFFVLGWCLAPLCSELLKGVLNHTRNVQSKDFERLPYPFWTDAEAKARAIAICRGLVAEATAGRVFRRGDAELSDLAACYAPPAAG